MMVSYKALKNALTLKALPVHGTEDDDNYYLQAVDDAVTFECILSKRNRNEELSDFEEVLKPKWNPVLSFTRTTDNRPNIHSSARPLGTYTYFTCAGDNPSDATAVGGSSGTPFCGHHQVGDGMSQSIYADFNCIKNDTWLHKGAIQWFDARNDELIFEVVPKVTATAPSSGTNFALYGGYLIIPAAGNGTIAVASEDIRLVQCVPNEYGTLSAGYWDATFNTTTKVFENITPNPSGLGGYNMFAVEVSLNRFGNRMLLLGAGTMVKPSDDTTQAGHGMRLRITATTVGADHEWWWNLHLGMFRKRTC